MGGMSESGASDLDHLHVLLAQRTFLLTFNDALRPLVDGGEVERTAVRLLGQELGADWVFIATIDTGGDAWIVEHDYADGVPSRTGRYEMTDFQRSRLPQWQAGQMSSVADCDTDPTLSAADRAACASFDTRAAIAVPLIRGGDFAALLSVNQRRPRAWSDAEVALTREVAERTWAAVERARAETALRMNEERLQVAITAAKLGEWSLDLSTGVMTCSDVCRANYGREPGDPFNYDDLWATIHPDDRERVQDAVRRAVDTCEDYDTEYRIVWPDGTIHFVLVRGRVASGTDGTPLSMSGVSLDITDRRRSEEVLRRSQERQAFLLNLADAVRPLADPVEIQTTAIRVLGEHLGANRVLYFEIHGTDYVVEHNYIHGAVALTGAFPVESFSPQVLEAQHAGHTVAVCDVAADPDLAPERKAAYAAIGVAALADVSLVKNGEFIAGLAIHFSQPHAWTPEEITLCEDVAERTWGAVERARSETALRDSEDKFRTLFNSIDEGFCIVEILFNSAGEPVDYRFVQANPAFVELTGLPTDALGKTARELVPDLEAFWVETYGGVALTGHAVRFENRSEAMNRWFDVYAARVGGAGSSQVAIVFNNISERKQAEADIRELNRLLEARIEERTRNLADERAALEVSNEELQAFNHSVSHDLMTPLRHIAGFAQLASRSLDDREKSRRYLNIVVEGAQRMETLIEGMLALSRTGQRELSVGVVDLNDLLRQSQLDVQSQRGGHAVAWRLGQLPQVQGDRVTLQQVMTNLLENAAKYSQARDPAVIEVWAEEDAQQWTIFVRDNGAGFDPAYAGKLFGIFQRLHHQDEFKGTGVGLSLVRRIITRHGGTVNGTAVLGQGATFWFTLPKPTSVSPPR